MSEEDEWFSLELQESRRVTKVQIARRMDCCWEQGQNIRITIGPSQSYDPSEPLCLPEITELRREEGLQDYICTGNLHSGKYVKINMVYVQGHKPWDTLGLGPKTRGQKSLKLGVIVHIFSLNFNILGEKQPRIHIFSMWDHQKKL